MVLGVLLGLLVILFPATALADNSVNSSVPENGAALTTAPTEVVMVFAEEVGDLRTVSLTCNTELIPVGPSTLSGNQREMTVPIIDPIPRGLCVVEWRVSDTDGEPNGSGAISFTVENATATTIAGDDAVTVVTTIVDGVDTTDTPAGDATAVIDLEDVESGEGPIALGRLLSTIGIAVVFGSLVLIAGAWPEGVEYLITIRFVRAAWILALVGTVLLTAAATAAVTDTSLDGGFNPSGWTDLLDAGWAGRGVLLRLVLVVVSAWAAFRPDRVNDPVTQMAALGIPALAVMSIGITRTEGTWPILGVGVGMLHALAMAVWVGGLILLARVVLSGPGEEDLVHAVRGFGRLSTAAIVVTIVTGFVQMIRLDGSDLFTSAHGRVVILKVLIVAATVFVGLSARQFVQTRLARAHEMTAPMADRLRRAFGIEAVFGVVAIAASTWLLALNPFGPAAGPEISYASETKFQIVEADLDVSVKLTRDTVGTAGLEVEVRDPDEGLTGLEIVLTAPPNPDIDTITQPVPLTGPGRAVLLEEKGLPLNVAGNWQIQITATTASGVVQSAPTAITINNADGTAPTTAITVPPSVVVTIDPTSSPTTIADG